MFTIGDYTLILVKKQAPVRLEKRISKKEQLDNILRDNIETVNLILLIMLTILCLILCFMVVPKTYGYFMY